VFSFSDRQRDAMDLRAGCGLNNHADFSAVTVVSRTDGAHVVVAMGAQGVLHRSPSGRWERRPVLDLRPLRNDGSTALYRVTTLTPLGLLVAAPVFWLSGRLRRGRRSGMAATVSAVAAVVIITVAGVLGLGTVEFTVTGPAIAVVAIAVFVAAMLIARHPVRPPAPHDGWPPPARTDPPPR
jgi:hypothetical protein